MQLVPATVPASRSSKTKRNSSPAGLSVSFEKLRSDSRILLCNRSLSLGSEVRPKLATWANSTSRSRSSNLTVRTTTISRLPISRSTLSQLPQQSFLNNQSNLVNVVEGYCAYWYKETNPGQVMTSIKTDDSCVEKRVD